MRLLYIDDDEGLARLVAKACGRRGYDVVTALNGTQGLRHAETEAFDVIALDHTMPNESGLDVLARLGSKSDRPPVVYVTGSGDARIAVEALKSGADDYVIKDLSGEFLELLMAACEAAVESWRLRRVKIEQEVQVREARDRAELLLSEVNHRVANSLGLVAAMVRMQAGTITDPVASHALQEARSRIIAVAGVHRRLYTSPKVGKVDVNDYLTHLLADIQDSFRDNDQPWVVKFVSDTLELNTDQAVYIGIAVSELVTNAYKYAYADHTPGEIRVKVEVEGEQASITVEDDGRGYDANSPASGTGLGTKILHAMATSLMGRITHDATHKGTRIEMQFPLG